MELLTLGRRVAIVIGDTVVHTTVRTPTNCQGSPLGAHRGEAFFLVEHRHGLETRRFDYIDEGITWSRDTSPEGADALRAAALLVRSGQITFRESLEGLVRRPVI